MSVMHQAGVGHSAAGHCASARYCEVCFHQKRRWNKRLEQQVRDTCSSLI